MALAVVQARTAHRQLLAQELAVKETTVELHRRSAVQAVAAVVLAEPAELVPASMQRRSVAQQAPEFQAR